MLYHIKNFAYIKKKTKYFNYLIFQKCPSII